MSNTIEDYLTKLKKELTGSDPATIQDALSDAEEHLRTALAAEMENQPDVEESSLISAIIAEYGTPEETAAAYREVEARTMPALARSTRTNGNLFKAYFGVFADPRAWGALLYMLISIVLGTIYFSWTVTGLSVSVSFALFIFGLPLVAFFLLSVRGIALVEGRIVEALLGVRMPRRTIFAPKELDWKGKLRFLFLDKYTWLMMLYMLLMLPLGVFYFCLFVILISVAVAFFAMPVMSLMFHQPVAVMGDLLYYLPKELAIPSIIAGALLLTGVMHLAKGLGSLQGKLAKAMLVSE
jgi:uncharacterized membrane protein